MSWPFLLTIDQFIAKHDTQAKALDDDEVVKDIHRLYVHIDAKSSALLTHVSIMVAVCMFFVGAPKADPTSNRYFIGEAFGYMSIALILLFCLGLSMYKAPKDTEPLRIYYARSCRARATMYLGALLFTQVFTVAVLFTIGYRWF